MENDYRGTFFLQIVKYMLQITDYINMCIINVPGLIFHFILPGGQITKSKSDI